MDKAYFLDILKKYQEGTATAEEEKFLMACYQAFESQPDIVSLLTDAEQERLKSNLHAGIMEQIALHEKLHVKTGRPVPGWFKAAAAVILLAGAATAGFLLLRSPATQEVATEQHTVQPATENNLITLPDGSSVLVSTGSKLSYPATFNGQTKREVYLEGKALFTVQQETGQPFVVHTGKLQTTVLGTTFEIRAPANAADITVTVIQGKVQVAQSNRTLGLLSANEQMVYNTGSQEHRQLQLNAAAQITWQQEDLFFDDVTMLHAAQLLEERFNISISIKDESLKEQRFSSTFLKDESLEQVLKSVCAFNKAAYIIDREKKTVTIYMP